MSAEERLGMVSGIVFTFAAWALTAHYVVFFQKVLMLERMPDMLTTLFAELFLVFFFMFLIFSLFCLPKGMSYLKCKKPKQVLCLGVLGTIGLWLYSLAITGPKTVNNIMTFSVNVFWFVIVFFALKIKFNKLSLIGVLLGFGGVFLVVSPSGFPSFYNIIIGRSFAILSGIILTMITIVLSYTIIKGESLLRIAFYYSLIGFILSGIVLFSLEVKAQVWTLPSLNLVIVMIITAIFFSIVLFLFLESFYYTDAYTLSAVTCFYPAAVVAVNWMLNKTPVQWPTIVGTMMLALGGMIVIMINCRSRIT